MEHVSRFLISLRKAPCRAALLEAAFMAPAALLIGAGVICWGGYMRLSYQVQAVADRALAAASAAPAGAERELAALAAAEQECVRQRLAARILDVSLVGPKEEPRLLLTYDASGAAPFLFGEVVPMPSATIVRAATVR